MKLQNIALAAGTALALITLNVQAQTAAAPAAPAATAPAPAAAAPSKAAVKAQRKAARKANRALARSVRLALAKAKGVDVSHINVRARGGAITLVGSVPEQAQIDTAGQVAQGVSGVTSVKNGLTIKRAAQ